VHAPVLHRDVVRDQFGDRREERFTLDRLGEVAIGAHLLRATAVEVVGLGREQHDLHRREFRTAAQFPGQLEAIHARHHDVGDDAVRTQVRNVAQRLGT